MDLTDFNRATDRNDAGAADSGASQPPVATNRRLLSRKQAAQKLGVSLRQLHRIESAPDTWLPVCIVLGPQSVRYVEAEIDEAIAKRAPRRQVAEEPAQLRRQRIEALKTRGVPA